MEMFNVICNVLDEMGYVIFEGEGDFKLSDYIVDSIQFISFIVSLEENLNVTIPDEFLTPKILKSAKGLANMLESYCNNGHT